ncbi:hypothetical protein F4V43_09885 [Paenibacillus spiritus]|uniref:Uncharacterized protein n=1 Tax=Paenibacillus spiritus TaxID=2496557 RepID=A0A5J5GAB5_9BACL|nr:hypothetical protein [Paenibacillus spiritus]KAA9004921.1 hypothetical protein F4V43_09885 [Paenibacillus spiritus]
MIRILYRTRPDSRRADGGHSRRIRKRGRTDGSISLFLMFALALIFLFTAVLIDYSRIAAANVQGERLARAAVRSLMSMYDADLQQAYGLYVYGGERPEEAVSRVLNGSLERSGRDDIMNIVPLTADSSEVSLSRPLGDYAVFRRQIAEEMKYKAPIDTALELAGKFKGLSGAMEEASRTTQLYANLQPLYDQREAALDRMLDNRRQAAEAARKLLDRIMAPPGGSIADSALGSIANAADIAAQYRDYEGKSISDMNRSEKEAPRYTEAISRYQEQRSAVIADIAKLVGDYSEESARLLKEAGSAMEEAGSLNAEMRRRIEEERASPRQAGYASADSWEVPPAGSASGEAANLREQAEQLLLPDSLLSSMDGWLSDQRQAADRGVAAADRLPAALAPSAAPGADGERLKIAVLSAAAGLDAYVRDYGTSGTRLERERRDVESRRAGDEERKALEQEAKTSLGRLSEVLGRLRSGGESQAGAEAFATIRRYAQENAAFNRSQAASAALPGGENDPEAAAAASMSSTDALYGALGSVLQEAGNRLFQSEYAALYFPACNVTSLGTSPESRNGPAGGPISGLGPEDQELEYVLYGLDKPGANIAAAYAEIFGIRLAIRTMEGFASKAGLGHPLLIVAAALVYGITEALKDMALLCSKGSIPLARSIPAELAYRDYLRLFLFMHGSGEPQLARMLALIRYHTGVNPQESCTYASATVRFGIRLWFLPGIAKLIQYTGAMPGETENGIRFRSVRADFSY